ncbi:GNAT family N-acetyltransferase [Corynebacterium kozikiae]|uniref:GNAT family N-acetyltransferase n=1 Tax=Corynebacterium kozikiae TaxID=2968469 RepID=UPI00211CC100|nr:GNAT family N-acetyltransferase [Corynebacterium sp. 76QC2CO]MCI6574739.1 GNAT family N-acetyltransferase [Arcanobacterium sp.]MCQ9343820.1 GNAT family N-acetyltransferase [Corynebacterium sp. 76QC2CO]MDY5854456.1 GNAT family N-acetyltransferase [Arcanobacterium sp.]
MDLPLTTQRLKLRAHTPEDVIALQRFYSQPEVARFLLDEPWSQEDATAKVEERLPKTDLNGPTNSLALVIEVEGQAIGDVALWFTDVENRVAEIGWVLDPAYGGKGYATEAVKTVLDLAFDRYSCRRVVAQMDARNNASAKLAERLGMVKEAHHRQDWFSKGEWTDTLIYAMLTSDR